MSVVRNIFSDLVEKRLWPIALALVVALVAVPVVLGRHSSAGGGGAAAGIQPPPHEAGRAAVELDTGASGGITKRQGRVRNPFNQPRAPQAEENSPAPSPRGSQPPSTGAGTGAGPTASTGGTGSTAPAPSAKPNTPKPPPDGDPLDTHHLTIRFGRADGQMKTYKDVARLSPLPTADNPFFVYTGVLKDGKTAVFLLSSDATATGDGHCKPSPKSCQTIEVEQGDTEFFDLTVDGQPVQYELDVVRVFRKGAKSAAANERHSVAGAAMVRSAHVNGSSAFKDAAAYRWLPDRGVLVRTPKHGAGRASANGGAAASSADAAALLPGQPVWHWQLGG